MAVARVGLEVEIAPAIRLPAPQQRAAADVIAAHPVEALDFGVGILDVVDEPVRRRRVRRVPRAACLSCVARSATGRRLRPANSQLSVIAVG